MTVGANLLGGASRTGGILSFGLYLLDRPQDFAVIPTRGADHFDELIGILLGWGVNFALCCDDDGPGRKAVKEYEEHWGLPPSKVFTLASVDPALAGKKIEAFLEEEDIDLVASHFGLSSRPTKGQIQLYFSEKLATGEKVKLSKQFMARMRKFDQRIRIALEIAPATQSKPAPRGVRKRSTKK